MRAHWGETLMGFVVLAFAGAFLAYALGVTGGGRSGGSYEVSAKFGEAGGIQAGAKVTVSGVKVGSVISVAIDPKNYMAVVRLSVDNAVKLPSDSTAKITSDGLLGGNHITIAPGGAALVRAHSAQSQAIFDEIERKFGHDRLEDLLDLLDALRQLEIGPRK